MSAHIRGWHVGIRVDCRVGPDGRDEITVYLTGGKLGSGGDKIIGLARPSSEPDGIPLWIPVND